MKRYPLAVLSQQSAQPAQRDKCRDRRGIIDKNEEVHDGCLAVAAWCWRDGNKKARGDQNRPRHERPGIVICKQNSKPGKFTLVDL